MTRKEKPSHSVCVLADVTSKGSSSFQSHSKRIERYSNARKGSEKTINFLRKIYKGDLQYTEEEISTPDAGRLLRRMESCSQWLWFRNYYTVGEVRLSKVHTCQIPLMCPFCAIRRGAKATDAYVKRFEQVRKENPHLVPYLLTLTVANGSDLQERYEHLTRSWKTYLNRRRAYFKNGRGFNHLCKIEGGAFAYETTYNEKDGWHPHMHAVVMVDPSNPIDFPEFGTGAEKQNSRLAREWHDITGDSFIVDCRPIDQENPAEGFVEVFKYALKFSDLDDWLKLRAYQILKGRRMSGSFGCFWGVKVPESDADDQLEDLPYAEMLYRFTKSGYSLFSISSPDETAVSSFVEPNKALDAIPDRLEPIPEGLFWSESRAVSPPVHRDEDQDGNENPAQDNFDYRTSGKVLIRYEDAPAKEQKTHPDDETRGTHADGSGSFSEEGGVIAPDGKRKRAVIRGCMKHAAMRKASLPYRKA